MSAETTTKRSLMDSWLGHGVVTAVTGATPRMRVIRVEGDEIPKLRWTPGQHLRVEINPLFAARTIRTGFRDALRSYTIWDADRAAGWFELCVLDHPGNGPGAQWSRTLTTGTPIRFKGPEGKLVAQPGAYHLFAGDETAAVAFRALIADPAVADRPVYGAIEVDSPADVPAFPRRDELAWVSRPADFVDAVRALSLPPEPGVAYVAGEAKTVQAVRAHLVSERGWPRRSVLTKPFWAPGKTGLE